MSLRVSVIVPVYNGGRTLGDCLHALATQSLPRNQYQIIVVDDGSTDDSASVAARFDVQVIRQRQQGVSAARNAGLRAASSEWIAFTDQDCIPSRRWLHWLLDAVSNANPGVRLAGVAGLTLGYQSTSPAARFVDLSGGLNAEILLAHPRFPFAPGANVMHRRRALEQVGGYDTRYDQSESCELHQRLRRAGWTHFAYEPRAIVLHRHRDTWQGYWRQQFARGRGLAYLCWDYPDKLPWSIWHEVGAWGSLGRLMLAALMPARGDQGLLHRGTVVKHLAQRLGFMTTYWDRQERARWAAPRLALGTD